jgi:hypothetical protein
MYTPPRMKVHLKCPNCGGKVMEGPQYRSTVEISCLLCWWRLEPKIERWEEWKKKVYRQQLNERTGKVSK